MEVDWNAEVVDQMDAHWRTRLRPRLDGLSDEEYFWEPVPGCWSVRRRGESAAPLSLGHGAFTIDYAPPPHDPEPVTTIAWRLAHLTDVLGPSTARRFETKADRPGIEYSGSAEAALDQLDLSYEAMIADVRGLGEAGLARPQGDLAPPQFAEFPVARMVMYDHVELIHHGAEICLLRDLYAWRTGDRV